MLMLADDEEAAAQPAKTPPTPDVACATVFVDRLPLA